MPVEGIGGFFFRTREPETLGKWYAEHLGVGAGLGPQGTQGDPFWRTLGGPVVFQPFKEGSDYFSTDKRYMLNFRVSGIDGMIAHFQAQGIAVETRPEWDDPHYGRFARVHDPDGNPIELWEPPPVPG